MFGGGPVMRTSTPPKIMSQRQRQNHKRRKLAAAQSPLDIRHHPDAAGIDVGAEELVGAVPPGRGDAPCVRTFSAFTAGLHALRDWLLACKIKTVALESTGNYWLCATALLEDAGIEVCLVNARHVKGVPGKKTDVCDAAWLQQLHAAGLLRGSFRPQKEILPLRYLLRHRGDLVAQAGQQVQLMQKVMTEMNLHIHHVFSDVDGVSAQAIITAILGGERDADRLAALRDRRCRAPLDKVKAALVGDYRPEYLFVLGQVQARWQQLGESIAQCDQEIARRTAAIAGVTEAPLPAAPAAQRRVQKNMIAALPVYAEAHRLLGVDLSAVPGISGGVLCVLLSELGTATHIKAKFRSAEAFASWLGLCPDNRISGGRILKAGTRKVTSRIANSLRLAANALSREQGRMGEFVRRFKGRLGKAEGIVAGAHKLARIIWAMIVSGQPYAEAKAFAITAASTARRLKHLQNQAKALNLTLVPSQ
jgi:transposase